MMTKHASIFILAASILVTGSWGCSCRQARLPADGAAPQPSDSPAPGAPGGTSYVVELNYLDNCTGKWFASPAVYVFKSIDELWSPVLSGRLYADPSRYTEQDETILIDGKPAGARLKTHPLEKIEQLKKAGVQSAGISLPMSTLCRKDVQDAIRAAALSRLAVYVEGEADASPASGNADCLKALAVDELFLIPQDAAEDDLEPLGKLETLRGLVVEAKTVDKGLKAVSGIKRLGFLDLSYAGISDEGLSRLGKLKQLSTLYLRSAQFPERGIEVLSGLENLRVLDLSGVYLTEKAMARIGGLEKLEVLSLDGSGTADAGLKHLEGLRNLRRLDLAASSITDKGMKIMTGFKGLQMLTLGSYNVTAEGLAQLSGMTGLRSLTLEGETVTDEGLRHLAGLEALEVLHLNRTLVSDAGLAFIGKLKNLRALFINDETVFSGEKKRISDAGLAHLAGLDKLEILDLDGCLVGDAGLAHLSGLNLRELSIGTYDAKGSIGTEGLKQIAKLGGLQALVIRDSKITAGSLALLGGLTHLRVLDLWSDAMTDEAAGQLVKMKQLQYVHVGELSLDAIQKIEEALPNVVIPRPHR
jgi:Leucine-rich repeat (LRR) protein